ncbi:MAG: polyprenyl synthetase family protein [Lachnospiraceae bacterium]
MKDFSSRLKSETEAVNTIVKEFLPKPAGYQEKLIEAADYSVTVGGKRLRPMIILESYRLCGGSDESICYPFMAALECIHSYSLVHDDLPAMDNDMYRRGNLTTHAKYGEDFGILAGDALLNYAFELILKATAGAKSDSDRLRMSRAGEVIANKSGIYGMAGGQSLDVALTGRPMSAEQLDFIFRLKTGALLEAAFAAGAILAGADEETEKTLTEAGLLVGLAFQIRDDILDVTGDQEKLGKPVLSDEKNDKTTYVMLYGLDKAQEDVRKYSDEAEEKISSCGDNEFLLWLVRKLVSREY